MAASSSEYQELLSTEVYVDVAKLRQLARHGVPKEVRGEVWKYLLNVSTPDQSEEFSQFNKMTAEYDGMEKTNNEFLKQIRGGVKRYHPDIALFSDPKTQTTCEQIILAFLNRNPQYEYNSGMVYVLGPFVYSLAKESDTFYCYEAVMQVLIERMPSINREVANFRRLFRFTQPELYNYFEEEEVEFSDFAISWMQFLLCRELPLECVLRLWDTYFAHDDGILEGVDIHPYICLAILDFNSEELLEMEHAEVKAFLQHLPDMDIDQVLAHAKNIRDEIELHEDW